MLQKIYQTKIQVYSVPRLGLALLTGLIVLLAVVAAVYDVTKLGTGSFVDFEAYFYAAQSLNNDETPYIVFIQPELVDAGIIGETAYIYPPFFAAALRPLVAAFSLNQLKYIWPVVEILCAVGAMLLLTRLFKVSVGLSLVTFAISGLVPVLVSMIYGQVSTVLLFLIVASLYLGYAFRHNRLAQIASGILLGIAIGIKVYPAFVLLIYVLYRRFTAAVSTLVSTVATGVFGLIFGGGVTATLYFFTHISPALDSITTSSDQSLKSLLGRIFAPEIIQLSGVGLDSQVVSAPFINAPWLVDPLHVALSGLIGVVSLALIVKLRYTHDDAAMLYSVAILSAAVIVVLPTVWPHYASLAVIPAYVIMRYIIERRAALMVWVFLLVCLLITTYRYWTQLVNLVPNGLMNKTMAIGLLMLWGMMVYVIMQYRQPADEPATLQSFVRVPPA